MDNKDRFNLSNPKNIALLAVLLGILFIVFPSTLLTALIYILGLVGISFGAYHIYSYFSDKKDTEVSSQLAIGLMFAALGLYFMVFPHYIISVSNFFFGLVILAYSFFLVQYAMDLRKAEFKFWYIILGSAVICTVLATFILSNMLNSTSGHIALIGIAFVVCGISQLLSDVLLNRAGFDRSKVKQHDVKVDASLFTSTFEGVKSTIGEVAEKLNEKQEEVVKEVKKDLAEAKEDLTEASKEIKEDLKQAHEEVKEDLAELGEELKEDAEEVLPVEETEEKHENE